MKLWNPPEVWEKEPSRRGLESKSTKIKMTIKKEKKERRELKSQLWSGSWGKVRESLKWNINKKSRMGRKNLGTGNLQN
jgi:hypothetical protein